MSGWRAVSSKVILSFDRAKIKPSRFSAVIPTTGRGSTTSKNLLGYDAAMGNTGCGWVAGGFATTLQVRRWFCTTAASGAKIPIARTWFFSPSTAPLFRGGSCVRQTQAFRAGDEALPRGGHDNTSFTQDVRSRTMGASAGSVDSAMMTTSRGSGPSARSAAEEMPLTKCAAPS